MMNRIGRERGWPPMGRAQFDGGARAARRACSSAARSEVAEKILLRARAVRPPRFLAQISVGTHRRTTR